MIQAGKLFIKALSDVFRSEVGVCAGEVVHVAVVDNVPRVPGVVADLHPLPSPAGP